MAYGVLSFKVPSRLFPSFSMLLLFSFRLFSIVYRDAVSPSPFDVPYLMTLYVYFSASGEILLAVVSFSFSFSPSVIIDSVFSSQSISASSGDFILSSSVILLCLRCCFLFLHYPSSFSTSGGAIFVDLPSRFTPIYASRALREKGVRRRCGYVYNVLHANVICSNLDSVSWILVRVLGVVPFCLSDAAICDDQ